MGNNERFSQAKLISKQLEYEVDKLELSGRVIYKDDLIQIKKLVKDLNDIFKNNTEEPE